MIESFKQQLIDSGYVVTEITPELFSVENFLSQDQIDTFWDIIHSTPQKDWEVEYHANLKHFCMEKFGRDDVDNLVAEGKFEITQNWKDKNFNILISKQSNFSNNNICLIYVISSCSVKSFLK
jgi:hypothetical protein